MLVGIQIQILAQLCYVDITFPFAVVGWFPAANVVAVRQTAATNVNPKRFIIPTF